ncbi:MAG: 2,3-epoxybenzoyl-CoA dihydrolase [Myxococcales bacterium]|nr:2,3-epoxybenzoyl-CoA dihydrolase [Myxococcota bacterium]MDW8284416.1 2,3-epoxybenzoyl-CoA dihydrolase [Myxococcales bacterium]
MEPPVASFETEPSRYRHLSLSIEGAIARLGLAVREDEPLRPGYTLKLNSYDLGVDIELADAVQRLRFSHPEVRAVVLTSDRERIFCAGANIHMLATSSHGFKVNFCKFTNETRLAIEDASAGGAQRYLAAVNGACAGGGYELAMACDEIWLIDDGSSTVSLPEVALLAVLPGTGGLTRLVDKRRVRRDRADVFATLAEGVRGRRAVEWGLVDGLVPRSRFQAEVRAHAERLAASVPERPGPGVPLEPLEPQVTAAGVRYRFVELTVDRPRRLATLTVTGPGEQPRDAAGLRAAAARGELWALRAFRELDDALLRLRFNEPTVGLVLLRTCGDPAAVLRADATLWEHRRDWVVGEVIRHMARVLRRLDQTAKSFFAVGEPGSCFAGSLLELALAADRSYFLDDPRRPVLVAASPLSGGALPMTHGLSRLQARFCGDGEAVARVLAVQAPVPAAKADELGLVTVLADELDFDDTLRLAIEERLSLSPDALSGMEANLRFPGLEGCDSKIFGRLSAWQNWIFARPNATGETGALPRYGKPERPSFDWRRT